MYNSTQFNGTTTMGNGNAITSGIENEVSSTSILNKEEVSQDILNTVIKGLKEIVEAGELKSKDERPVQDLLNHVENEKNNKTKWQKIKEFLKDQQIFNAIINAGATLIAAATATPAVPHLLELLK